MKSGKYRYFAGGFIKGLGSMAMRAALRSPQLKKEISEGVKGAKNAYKDWSKVNTKFGKALFSLDVKRGKSKAIKDSLKGFSERVVKDVGQRNIFGPRAKRRTIERKALARAISSIKNLYKYEKQLSKKASAIMNKQLKKIKEN